VQRGASAACLEVGRLKMMPVKTPKQHQREEEEEHE
jgi:hypothetical protein